MRRATLSAAMAVAALVLMTTGAVADDPPANPFAPGPEHRPLAAEVGVWDAEIEATAPGQTEPMKSKGVETNTLLGGRWLISDVKAEFAGMPFNGHGVFGYDAKKKKYVGTWVDSMSVRIDTLEGTYDEKTKSLTYITDMIEPMTGKAMTVKMVTELKGDSDRVFTEYAKPEGEKDFVKVMTITYKKRKN